jgi:ABC-2 type transport system ATP-binding protein
MLEVRDISKSFGTKKVLRGITFTLSPGEIVGFVGANGSGKTTTMRLIMGLLSPDYGSIEIDGVPSDATRKNSRMLGYMPEERGLYMNQSLQAQLNFFGNLQGVKGDLLESHIESLLERLGIQQYRYQNLGELSLGNQQRVQLAVSLLHQPRYLILDEPFNGLDPNGVEALREVLIKEAAKGVGIIFSSHILPYVEEISEEVLILNQGRIHKYSDERIGLADYYQSMALSHG